jgi:tetratricopeptide (TPR) repeat protein
LAISERLAASHPQEQKYRSALWNAHQGIAQLLLFQNDPAGAIEASSKALALGEALVAEDPMNSDYRRALVLNYRKSADYRANSDPRGALEDFRRAVALQEELLAADPANALTRRDLAYTHKRIADFLANLEDNSQALTHFNQAVETYEKLTSDAPGDLPSRLRTATCRAGAAGMRARLGELDLALQECRKAIALLREISEDPANSHHQSLRGEAYQYLGYAYRALATSPKASASESAQHTTAAREMFQQTINILDELRRRGFLDAANEGWAREMAGEIAKCDAALAR